MMPKSPLKATISFDFIDFGIILLCNSKNCYVLSDFWVWHQDVVNYYFQPSLLYATPFLAQPSPLVIFRDFIFSLGSLHDGCLVASSRLFSVFYKKCPRHNVSNRSKRRQQLSIDAAVWHDKNTQIHQLNDIVSPRVICRQKIKTIIIFREVEISLKLVQDMIRIVRMLVRWPFIENYQRLFT